MKPVYVLLPILALTACATPAPQTHILADAPPDMIEAAEIALKQDLKDPDSVQIRDVTAREDDSGKRYVCGWYNAKNSFGGYVGFQPFMAVYDGYHLVRFWPSALVEGHVYYVPPECQ